MGRAAELASIVGAGAAGAIVAVLAVGGSLLLVLPAVAIVSAVTVVTSGRKRHPARRS